MGRVLCFLGLYPLEARSTHGLPGRDIQKCLQKWSQVLGGQVTPHPRDHHVLAYVGAETKTAQALPSEGFPFVKSRG